MNRNALQSLLAMGILIGGGGFLLAFFQPTESPEFFASLCSAALGLLMIVLVIFLNRLFR
jgi:hypothetical protein